MGSETYSQNDFNSLPFSYRDDDVNSLEFNKYTPNPYTSNIIEKYEEINNFEPEYSIFKNFEGSPKNPKSYINLEDEKDNFKMSKNYTEQNDNKIIYNLQDFANSNFQKKLFKIQLNIINHQSQINLKILFQQIQILKK